MSLLCVQNLSACYGSRQILTDISLEAHQGSIVALLGPNGAGKTTLLRTITGLLPLNKHAQNSGLPPHISFAGKEVGLLPVHDRVSAGLVYLPQHCSLFSRLTVYENLLLIFEHHSFWRTKRSLFNRFFSGSSDEDRFSEQVHYWLGRVGLSKTLHQKAGSLSGGQKRKLEVVRCLLLRPRLIMLDEPFAGVDPKSIYELKEVFVELASKNIGILISDHHVDQLLSIADHIYVVYDGKIAASGDIEAIMSNTYTQEMYLGGQFHAEMAKRFLG